MFSLVTGETVSLTRQLAEEFRDMRPWPGERDLDKLRVKHLRGKLLAGYAVPFQWVSAEKDGIVYRMNAQHSSNALCELNGEFPQGALVQKAHFRCHSMNDLALLFRQFDDRRSSRSPLDVSGAYQRLYDDLQGVTRATGKLAIEGVVWYRKNVVGLPVKSGDDIYELFAEPELRAFATFAGSILNIKTREMEKTPVVGAMFGTYGTNASAAKEFWSHVARGDEPEDGDPAAVLDAALRAIAEKSEPKLVGLKPAQIYQGCITSWNASRHNRSIRDVRFDTRKGLVDIER